MNVPRRMLVGVRSTRACGLTWRGCRRRARCPRCRGSGSAGRPGTRRAPPGERYLAIATGFLGGTGGSKFQLVALAEGFALDDTQNARLRLVHASPDAPAVDLGVLNAEKVVAPVLVAGVSFGSASEAVGLTTSPGTLPIGVAPAGNPSTVDAAFHVTVTAGVRALGIATGALDPRWARPSA
ncbi:MAG: hypothetical protein WKG00_34140 [Polyangiaceae bacterium]